MPATGQVGKDPLEMLGADSRPLLIPISSSRLLWYPGNNHALSGVEAEADGFMNMALWLLKHLKC